MIEASISAELWRWCSLEPPAKAEITLPRSELAVGLEFFLTRAFNEIEFTRSRKIWCDGVLGLLICQLDKVSFRIGAATFSPSALDPVELEFYYSESGSLKPLRIILRFGFADGDRANRDRQHKGIDAGAVLANRPQSNQEWAVAVELTPT